MVRLRDAPFDFSSLAFEFLTAASIPPASRKSIARANTEKCRILDRRSIFAYPLDHRMPATARFDLKMNADDKEIVARAAALMGITMAG